ncbi:MAG: isochorismatase family protein [Planctomycetota bacterium]|jgi:nicotinamidase-related amidase
MDPLHRERPGLIDRENVTILVIDAQQVFLDKMAGDKEPVLKRLEQILLLAYAMEVPLIATLERAEGEERASSLPERLEKVFPPHGKRWEKRAFNFCSEPAFEKEVIPLLAGSSAPGDLRGRQGVVAGGETDVCVLQTVLGLLDLGMQVFLLEDALFTSEPNPRPALRRMEMSGAVPATYKTFYHEMTRIAGEGPRMAAQFNAAHPNLPPLIDPEQLPS